MGNEFVKSWLHLSGWITIKIIYRMSQRFLQVSGGSNPRWWHRVRINENSIPHRCGLLLLLTAHTPFISSKFGMPYSTESAPNSSPMKSTALNACSSRTSQVVICSVSSIKVSCSFFCVHLFFCSITASSKNYAHHQLNLLDAAPRVARVLFGSWLILLQRVVHPRSCWCWTVVKGYNMKWSCWTDVAAVGSPWGLDRGGCCLHLFKVG